MFFAGNPCTIMVGKCWTMPHNYHTKEKMKMKHKRREHVGYVLVGTAASLYISGHQSMPQKHAEENLPGGRP